MKSPRKKEVNSIPTMLLRNVACVVGGIVCAKFEWRSGDKRGEAAKGMRRSDLNFLAVYAAHGCPAAKPLPSRTDNTARYHTF